MTLREAAALLRVSDAAVLRQAIARGSLKATKLGRDWIVDPLEVERYAREHRRELDAIRDREAPARALEVRNHAAGFHRDTRVPTCESCRASTS